MHSCLTRRLVLNIFSRNDRFLHESHAVCFPSPFTLAISTSRATSSRQNIACQKRPLELGGAPVATTQGFAHHHRRAGHRMHACVSCVHRSFQHRQWSGPQRLASAYSLSLTCCCEDIVAVSWTHMLHLCPRKAKGSKPALKAICVLMFSMGGGRAMPTS